MKKNIAVAKPLVFLAIAIILFIAPLLGCNRNYEPLAITDVKYEMQCGYLFVCWYTNDSSISSIYTCTIGDNGTCQQIAVEPEAGNLHMISVCTDDTVEKYQIKVVNPIGEEDWQEFDNPYLTK